MKDTTLQSTYNNLSINTGKEQNNACHTEILDRHHAHLSSMINKHSKVMQVRFDLRYPQDSSIEYDKSHLHTFNYNLKRKLDRERCTGGHKVDPRIITVTEQHNKSDNIHIHGLILVNGNAKKSYYPLLQEIETQWKTAIKTDINGLVDYCNKQGKNGMVINRNSEDYENIKNKCSYQASYLAKVRGKDNRDKGSWLVSGTRVPTI